MQSVAEVLAARTCVHVWKSEFTQRLDAELAARFPLFDLPWEQFPLLPDRMHFTWPGYVAFVRSLVAFVSSRVPVEVPVHVIADSTIAYWDYDHSGRHTQLASLYLKASIAKSGRVARVDAIRGAGFVARSSEGMHFRNLRKRWDGNGSTPTVVVVGGWNDEAHDWERLRCAIGSFGRPPRSGVDRRRA